MWYPMDDLPTILTEIDGYCTKHNIAPTTFGRKAVNDGKLVARIRAGSCTIRTLVKIRAFLDATPENSGGDQVR